LNGNTLLFANRSEEDIIIKDELDALLGGRHIDILSQPHNGEPGRYIDKTLLKPYITGSNQYYYICGPDKFTEAMVQNLEELGVTKEYIIIEE
jgi:ferredoxin-NADP reductase